MILFFGAHSAIETAACGNVKLVRTMKGEASVIAEVAAAAAFRELATALAAARLILQGK